MARPWRIEFAGALYHNLASKILIRIIEEGCRIIPVKSGIRAVLLICEQARSHGEKKHPKG